MNRKIIGKLLGYLLVLEGAFLLPPALLSMADRQQAAARAFLLTILLCAAVGAGAIFFCRSAKRDFYAREGFLIVSLGWIVLSVVGALPFYLSGEIPSYVDALFETVSGFTTTGSSILNDVEALSRGMLFWRSFTHWLGGMGILVFLLAIVPMGKEGGYSVHILRAESPGPSVGKLVPRMRQTAGILYLIYIALTLFNIAFLLIGRMPLFDAVCTAVGTAGTGGFGIKNNSMAGYSPYIQSVCTVFMALFGVNFTLYYLLLIGKWRDVFHSEELWFYLMAIFGVTAVITVNILPLYGGQVRTAVHDAAFSVSSIITTTGFATADFNQWPQLSRSLLVTLMLMGATAGSTGGGMKCARVMLLGKSLSAQVKQAIHPRSINLVRMEGRVVGQDTLQGLHGYLIAYMAIMIVSFLVLAFDQLSLETNLTAVISCLNNIGPGLDAVGPTGNFSVFSTPSKLVLMLDMLLGRLEIFPLLIMLSPYAWRKAG